MHQRNKAFVLLLFTFSFPIFSKEKRRIPPKEKRNRLLLKLGYHSISPTELGERARGMGNFYIDIGEATGYSISPPSNDIGFSLEYRYGSKVFFGLGMGMYDLSDLNWSTQSLNKTDPYFLGISYLDISYTSWFLALYFSLFTIPVEDGWMSLLLGVRGEYYSASAEGDFIDLSFDELSGYGRGLQFVVESHWLLKSSLVATIGIGYRTGFLGGFSASAGGTQFLFFTFGGEDLKAYTFDLVKGGKRYRAFRVMTYKEYQDFKNKVESLGYRIEDEDELRVDISGLEIYLGLGFRF